MENPEEILQCLEEFSKIKPKDIPRELEEYLCFVAKTGNPVYQWPAIKSLFRQKLINVVTEFYEAGPSVEIPSCLNVDLFNYNTMKTFILEKLDTFVAAPFTVQRICELLTTPRKQYNRIDKYMRALEKNILVVSTTEPGNRRSTENGDGIVNGLESEHLAEGTNDINIEEMDESNWLRQIPPTTSVPSATTTSAASTTSAFVAFQSAAEVASQPATDVTVTPQPAATEELFTGESRLEEAGTSTSESSVITCHAKTTTTTPFVYVSIEPVVSIETTVAGGGGEICERQGHDSDSSVTITAIPANVQKRRDSIEPVVSVETATSDDSEKSNESVASSDDSTPETTPETNITSEDTLKDPLGETTAELPEEIIIPVEIIASVESGAVLTEETVTTATDDVRDSPRNSEEVVATVKDPLETQPNIEIETTEIAATETKEDSLCLETKETIIKEQQEVAKEVLLETVEENKEVSIEVEITESMETSESSEEVSPISIVTEASSIVDVVTSSVVTTAVTVTTDGICSSGDVVEDSIALECELPASSSGDAAITSSSSSEEVKIEIELPTDLLKVTVEEKETIAEEPMVKEMAVVGEEVEQMEIDEEPIETAQVTSSVPIETIITTTTTTTPETTSL